MTRARRASWAIAAVAAACSHSSRTTAPPPPPPAPTVVMGTSTTALVAGAPLVLTWVATDATELLLTPTPGAVAGRVIQLTPAASATWCVEARNITGSDVACAAVDVVAATAPPPDVQVAARTIAGGGVLVWWPAQPMASGYTVERTEAYGNVFLPFATVAGDRPWIFDATTHANSFYTYRVRASNAAGASAGVTIGSISAPPPPEGPRGPVVTALDGTVVAPGGILRFTTDVPATYFLPGGPGTGSITPDGVYEAPAQTGTVLLAATADATVTLVIVVQ